MLRRTRISVLSGVALWVCFSGCQGISTDYHKLNLATVDGKLRLDGQPLPNAHIIFQADDGTFSYGKSDGSGNYKLMFNSEKAGVLPGEKIVRIRRLRSFSGFAAPRAGEGESVGKGSNPDEEDDVPDDFESNEPVSEPPAKDTGELPDSYNEKSQLRATVADGNQTINFDLNSDGSTTAATD